MTWRSWLNERRLAACPTSVFSDSKGLRWRIESANALDIELVRTIGRIDAAIDWCRSTLDDGSVAIDIGANAGYWTLPLAQVSKRVVAFEPDSIMRTKLLGNLALNPRIAGKVAVHDQAVADATGQSAFNIRRVVDGDANLNTGLSSLISSTYLESVVTVPTLALDDIAEEHLGFIKIDVEGAESLVIRGGVQTLEKHMPLLHWEAAYSIDEAASSFNCRDTLSQLDELGYRHFAVLNDASTRPILAVDDLRDVGYDVNVISAAPATEVPPGLAWLG